MKHLLLCLTVLVATGILHAQDTVKLPPKKPAVIKEDSTKPTVRRKSEVYREAFKHVRRKFDSTLFTARDTASNSDFAEDLERVYQILNHIPVITESFAHLPDIDNKLDLEDSALDIIKERMSQSD